MAAAATTMDSMVDQRKGGFLPRLGAVIIDGIILFVVQFVLSRVLGPGIGGGLGTLISIAYSIYFWTSTGQTPGHRLLGLKVVKTDGSNLDLVTAIIRYVGEIVSAIPLCLGFLWVIWDDQKQGWHDKIAKTYVVHV